MPQRRAMLKGFTVVLVPALSAPACGAMPATPLNPLTADDFRNSGQRGVGFGLLAQGERSGTDINALVALGAGHVRMFVNVSRIDGGAAFGVDSKQLATIDAMVTALEARGIRIIMTAGFGGDERGPMWNDARLLDSAIEVWRQLALRLKGRAAVAAFDLVNEPVPPAITDGLRQSRWLAFASRIVDAVRKVDPQRVLIVESAPDATPHSFATLRPLPFDNLVYSLHSYYPIEFTHQGVMKGFERERAYPETLPDGKSSATGLVEAIEVAAQFARKYDKPIYVGEFSAIRSAPGESTPRYISDSIALFQRHGFSWCYHEYRAWYGWDPERPVGVPNDQRDPRDGDAPLIKILRAAMRAKPS